VTRAASRWICCQIGAREHYALPRILHRKGALECLITELWAPPDKFCGFLYSGRWRRLRERFHRDLRDARIISGGWPFLMSEVASQLLRLSRWETMIRRNEAFEQLSIAALRSNLRLEECSGVFAYSYAAEKVFRYARERGLRTILGQIDAGPFAEKIYHRVELKYRDLTPISQSPPPGYWDKWRRECSLADELVVNSEWAKTAIVSEGISERKIRIVPVAYETPMQTGGTRTAGKLYPERFSAARPLRVLFLGTICVRKGIGELLEAASLLRDENIEFVLVGSTNIQIKALERRKLSNVRWIGRVPRTAVAFYMASADVFVFPTHSDGFGLTQLEAQASALPVIASRNCGNVVKDGQNGLLLNDITGREIARTLGYLVANPATLAQMSARAAQRAGDYRLESISQIWQHILEA
jgi:glycosyltransferase involved in cell wall biosynthesis